MKMADDDGVEGAGYWLPSEFFTDDDFVTNKENSNSERFPCNFQTQKFQYDAVGDLAAGEVAKLKLNPTTLPAIYRNTSVDKTRSLFPPQFKNVGPRAVRGGGGMRMSHGPHAAAARLKRLALERECFCLAGTTPPPSTLIRLQPLAGD